jgi:hypothetical protein
MTNVPVDDPRWETFTEPLKEYLSRPRSWKDLVRFEREVGWAGNILRNALGWLELKGHARALTIRGKIHWARYGISSYIPEETASPRPSSQGVPQIHLGSGSVLPHDGEGEGHSQPIIPLLTSPQDHFVDPPSDLGELQVYLPMG